MASLVLQSIIEYPVSTVDINSKHSEYSFIVGEKKERCQPVSHCWTPDSKLYCGCKGGQVICVDTETNRVTIVLNPSVQESERNRTETLSLLRKTTMESIAEIEEEQSKI